MRAVSASRPNQGYMRQAVHHRPEYFFNNLTSAPRPRGTASLGLGVLRTVLYGKERNERMEPDAKRHGNGFYPPEGKPHFFGKAHRFASNSQTCP